MRRIALAVVLAVGLALAPLAAEAQETTRRPLVGFLCNITKLARAFGEGLRELGYVDGRNIFVEYRCTEGRTERGPELAAALLRLKPDVLVGASDPLVKALMDATHTIPIVMAVSGDPVGNEFVASLGRPRGNVTGLSIFAPELAGKRLELLKTVAPNITQFTVLVNPTNPNASGQLKETEAAALSMGVRLKLLRVSSTTELDKALSGTGRAPATALFISSDALFIAERRHIADIALAKRMPAMGFAREFAEDGLLISYGASLPALNRRAAIYVDKILKGARPADLPVEQPTKFELVVNLKTAKALGLTIPPSVLGRADQVIE
jgi:putative tryptophan/tyrosine transport system substrate-binding protein